MPGDYQMQILLKELLAQSHECEWLEFKKNNTDKQEIGEYISALANSAALLGKPAAYLVWGIEDGTHKVVGTTFKPHSEKVGAQALDMWLTMKLLPRVDFTFHEVVFEDKPVVVLVIRPVTHQPVRFEDNEFVRVGSHKTKLRDHPAKERQLWQLSSNKKFEDEVARERATADDVLQLLNYQTYFALCGLIVPDQAGIIDRLVKEKFLIERADTTFDITNLGALLFARDLSTFGPSLSRKAIRVIVYKGNNRIQAVNESVGKKGYAAGFEELIKYIDGLLPTNEIIGQALRVKQPMYPELAIRELVANSIIHQDLAERGTSPTVEIFARRVEISNSGVPLIDTLRFIDEPPQSRNETMAALMRRLNICEERGSGIDKVIFQIELFQLPAPEFRVTENHTIAVLFAHRGLSAMSKADKIRACYQHACLCFVTSEEMTNTSLRKRFGIADQNYAIASRIIADAIEAQLIRQHDPSSASRKHAKYVPFWA
jgi:predicted HTH transcriptional regulator